MLKLSLIGLLLIVVTVVIQAIGTTSWVRHLGERHVDNDGRFATNKWLRILSSTGLILVGLHIVQISLWALTYRLLVPVDELPSFEAAIYFSFVTFTTLGYGDITLSDGWRLLSGIEAMNGILLVGWSTAVLFAVVQRIWQSSAQVASKEQQ